ncbi:uncharacterized protein LOC123977696 [Micropterus dolomieu]|uniref:uncharacterized protein LOC123977696 n=1 Tax=Micropterus dolomieu TaxID=147949 RepID=UPI001E8CAA7E|nr:uncharacterized protein LOC123977696 [Micropterus dolomieu]
MTLETPPSDVTDRLAHFKPRRPGLTPSMPRGKSHHRALAASRREAEKKADRQMLEYRRGLPPDFVGWEGTGKRHRVRKWPISPHTNRQHKLVIPAVAPGNKFVLVVGDSHLRTFADDFVAIPSGILSFGFMSTPSACAAQLRTELVQAQLPCVPDLVLAPSNSLTASRTSCEAGQAFHALPRSACELFPDVFVLDFVPRLTVAPDVQEVFHHEFHRVAAGIGLKYYSSSDQFPLNDRSLWSRDGIHLSDDHGMLLLNDVLWNAAFGACADVSGYPAAACCCAGSSCGTISSSGPAACGCASRRPCASPGET